MATSFKKLLLVWVTILLGLASCGAMAQPTNYDFTWTGNDSGSVTGVLTVDASTHIISGITGTVSGVSGGGGITGLLPVHAYMSNDNKFTYPSPYLTDTGFSFTTAAASFNIERGGSTTYYLYSTVPSIIAGTLSASSSGAPEIDGSLAPKVGFLLGCLFLMFGRKKQNTEPMTTA